MLNKLLSTPNNLPFRRLLWKGWYNHFASKYGDINIVFMNLGYADLDPDVKQLQLNSSDQGERYCIQLYHYVASAIPLEGLDVLEVGCGRGGGSSYIARYLKPRSMTGVDFSESNIKFCNENHFIPQLKFCVGDAESLLFNDCSFDAVINVESSHCYGNMKCFFAEVFRVLRPKGYFLFSDFRPKEAIDTTKEWLKDSKFKMVDEEIISANVLKSMDLENERKLTIIHKRIPKYLHGVARWFTGIQGSPVYEAFKNCELEYLSYVLQKQS